MGIKERDGQRMVIGPTIGVGWILLLAIAAFIGILPFGPWDIVIAIIIVMAVVGELKSNKLIIDKATETITVEKRHFLLIHQHRVIPFSRVAVRGVTVEKKAYPYADISLGRRRFTWNVYLVFGVPGVGIKKIKVDGGGNEKKIRYIADEISRLLGK